MDKVPSIVQGEASESDSDQEDISQSLKPREIVGVIPAPHGAVISGEAPESDEEHQEVSSIPAGTLSGLPARPAPRVWDSLLHKKLGECNVALHTDLLGLVRSSVQNSLQQLSSSEQTLLKSQMRLQRASTALRSLDSTSSLLAEKLSLAACSAYLPPMRSPP